MAFKMKGHTLPGIKQKSEGNTDLKDGRSGSAVFQHRVDDVPSHQDEYGEEHYEDLQTDEEHKNGTRTHWPDGTKRTKREIFEWDENKAEEEKEKDKKDLKKLIQNGKTQTK